ncbi:L,D-transpeptidase [Actinacidiphila sp. ITFR-21]|uniref:L,D-transpeptidase n=1 Tax=Actinacidiphila sp. ITFR-21 TaxID=3075199 RepID=UPI002889D186|nr:Ig-like domain-containing protein [Streptomyces sp. ITFR-21]WNI18191.1 Ig-like domain-containing protein [Streptomyces sp. ITFR-21]
MTTAVRCGTAGAAGRPRGGVGRWIAGALAAAALLAGCAAGGAGRENKDSPAAPPSTAPGDTFIGFFSPEEGATVGTGMIVSLRFNRTITDRAAVERHITVTADPAVPVAGHWFGARRLDLRPAGYWRSGSRVTLHLRLRGVRGAPGTYGSQSKDVAFTVGRDQRSTVDAAAHVMTVERGGRVLRVLPVTAGSPRHTTYNGIMVIAEKYVTTRMNGRTVGFGGEYDIPDVPHAMRLTGSGTFVHGNYWSPPDVFGTANVSHGCVGLRDVRAPGDAAAGEWPNAQQTPAGWFFAQSLVGDQVRVVHSDDRTVAPDNGMGGWNLDWAAWRSGSALGRPHPVAR